jgi:hypothetical protein
MQAELFTELPTGYLPCSRPELVAGYVSIQDIINGDSGDFSRCRRCEKALCQCHLHEKRQDPQYNTLLEHFRAGGMINQPVYYEPEDRCLSNGHHRLAAAMDAGYTHIPYQSHWGKEEDWEESFADKGFKLITE